MFFSVNWFKLNAVGEGKALRGLECFLEEGECVLQKTLMEWSSGPLNKRDLTESEAVQAEWSYGGMHGE